MSNLELQLEQYKINNQLDSYIDTITLFAEENEIDVEDVASKLRPEFVNKLKYEFIKRNMVRGEKITTSMEDSL